jgi:hypothetical protein
MPMRCLVGMGRFTEEVLVCVSNLNRAYRAGAQVGLHCSANSQKRECGLLTWPLTMRDILTCPDSHMWQTSARLYDS